MKKIFSVLMLFSVLLTACGVGMSAKSAASDVPFGFTGAGVMAAKTGEVSGAFVTIKNNSGQADRLIGAASDLSEMTQVHETTMENNVMSMREVAGIDLPAGAILELKHGSYHIMLMNLKKDLKDGEMVTITLKFEKAGDVPVSMMVMPK
ncbi:MAG: copper chaperone PCu(A)C [Chloroflexi bacterium]|nr:copper chaperone PCu(A)C [Chloroflexota bacterium]